MPHMASKWPKMMFKMYFGVWHIAPKQMTCHLTALANVVRPFKLLDFHHTNCIPIISYASAVREFSANDMRRCHVAVNNVIRRIFSFAVWQSVRDLPISHGYKSVYEIFAVTKSKFLSNVSSSSNSIVRHLSSIPD